MDLHRDAAVVYWAFFGNRRKFPGCNNLELNSQWVFQI